jgi:hypothetical protein
MSLLNSKFDFANVDHPVCVASLAQVLKSGDMTLNANGTPTPGTFQPGDLVTMTSGGVAQLATTTDLTSTDPQMVFVTVDGDVDYSGSFVRKLTVLHGGISIKTDRYRALDGSNAAIAYAPSTPLTFHSGKIVSVANAKASAPAGYAIAAPQIIGYVGPDGLDSANGVLHVMLPQGAGI